MDTILPPDADPAMVLNPTNSQNPYENAAQQLTTPELSTYAPAQSPPQPALLQSQVQNQQQPQQAQPVQPQVIMVQPVSNQTQKQDGCCACLMGACACLACFNQLCFALRNIMWCLSCCF